MAPRKILCVAEKPSIAKAVAQHLAGGALSTTPIRGNKFVKNYDFEYNFPQWGNCSVTMTSVSGHLTGLDFLPRYRKWDSGPPAQLFDAETVVKIDPEHKPIADNIQRQARFAQVLFIWTDCDREGEHIGSEVREQALKANQRISVTRAKFSNTERSHVIQAAHRPDQLDDRQASAVATRIELDLRIGAAFTRLQTLQLRTLGEALSSRIISYGSCQFPTLGFVVERYFRVKNFRPETFWTITLTHVRDGVRVSFNWRRVHLFDRGIVTLLFEKCLDAQSAQVVRLQKRPTSKWRPLPLTTVELQIQGSRFLRMDSKRVMRVAEQLYTQGWISYPRTETDQFSKDFNLLALIEKQRSDGRWGSYAQGLLDGGFKQPRPGKNNDQAHPPIHPVNYVAATALSDDERRVYEFVVRRFLACCSDDAHGEATDVELEWGGEGFHTHGLLVLARNYLDVYVYEKWESSRPLPPFQLGESFEPTEATMADGKTTAPNYLTEPELIGLMDANGIGTDATMADHVGMVKDRDYVAARPRSGSGRNTVQELIPTKLGVGLVEGYDNLGLEVSVSKPFLRKEIELKMKAICDGRKSQREVVHESIQQYQAVFGLTQRNITILKTAVRRYVFEHEAE